MTKRHGLSELTAALMLIVITVVVGVGLYELYFAGQGSSVQSAASQAYSVVNSAGGNPPSQYNQPAQVSIGVVTCNHANGKCTIQLYNTGGSDTQAVGCSISGVEGTVSPNDVLIQAGASPTEVTCTSGGQWSAGDQANGLVFLGNGASVSWAATWQ